MDFSAKLAAAWTKNDSLLCIGLDPNASKLPPSLAAGPEAVFTFNKAIIDATADLVCAYKPNVAFYEALGEPGMAQLKKTSDYIHQNCEVPVILDAKRADVGNTNDAYVQHIFDYLQMDAVTLHPYFGGEALQPFLARQDKGCIILCRTSNPGAGEFQDLQVDGQPLYQYLARQVAEHWNANNNCYLVVGATYPEEMKQIREIVGEDIGFLIPGIGAQGGDVEATVKAGINSQGTGVMISSSRAIIFASSGENFAEAARAEAQKLRDEINKYRS